MKKQPFFKRHRIVFKHFAHKAYSLFAVLGKEVLIGTLSVATLTHAKADGISTRVEKADSAEVHRASEIDLDEVSVTASRAPLTRAQQVRMVSVLEREQIAAAPVQSVNDLLKYVASVDVRQRGPLGAQTDISIRGGNYNQTAILLNGINICDAQTGHNAFDFPVDIADIERIEIIEGPAGRVYGTSSLLGAINIVTKNQLAQESVRTGDHAKLPETTTVTAHLEGGSYGYLSGGAAASVASSRVASSLSAGYTRSDGYSRCKAGTLNADYSGVKAFWQGRYDDEQVAVTWHAGMSMKDFGSNTFYGAKWDDQFEHTLKTYTALGAETKRGAVHLRPQIYWNRSWDRFELYRDAPDTYPYNYHRADVFGVNLAAHFDWLLGRTALAAELRNEDLVSGNLGEPLATPKHIRGTDRDYEYGLNRTNIQFALEHDMLLRHFTLSAGLIAVKNSWADMPMKVYPSVDASLRVADGWKLFASLNTSLRMPSATELYYSVGGHKADKHLKPEEVTAVEGGLAYARRGFTAKASVYHNHANNLIDWIMDTTAEEQVWQSVNFGTINSVGVRVDFALGLTDLLPGQQFLQSAHVGWSYMNQNHDEQAGIQSQYTLEYLRNKLTADLQTKLWRELRLGLNYRLQNRTGTYTDLDGTVHKYATYGVLDARLSWTARRYVAYVEANNVLDKSYRDYGAVAQPGAWIIAGVSVKIL